jgi:hypothetical protein
VDCSSGACCTTCWNSPALPQGPQQARTRYTCRSCTQPQQPKSCVILVSAATVEHHKAGVPQVEVSVTVHVHVNMHERSCHVGLGPRYVKCINNAFVNRELIVLFVCTKRQCLSHNLASSRCWYRQQRMAAIYEHETLPDGVQSYIGTIKVLYHKTYDGRCRRWMQAFAHLTSFCRNPWSWTSA